MNSNQKSIVVKCEAVKGVKTPFGSEVKMLMHPELMDLKRDVSVIWVTLPPGATTGLHCHPEEVELEYIASGNGILDAGADRIEVEPQMLVFNPPGLYHNVRNTGKEILRLLRVHIPALPKGEELIGKCIEAARPSSKKYT